MSINYKGNFMTQLYKALKNNPETTIGETLFSFLREHNLKKHYFYATDEEIYNSLEKFNKAEKEKEESVDEKEYAIWVGKNLYNLSQSHLDEILTIEERKDEKDKQGFIFALEQISIIKD